MNIDWQKGQRLRIKLDGRDTVVTVTDVKAPDEHHLEWTLTVDSRAGEDTRPTWRTDGRGFWVGEELIVGPPQYMTHEFTTSRLNGPPKLTLHMQWAPETTVHPAKVEERLSQLLPDVDVRVEFHGPQPPDRPPVW